jgi:hypothetical protein
LRLLPPLEILGEKGREPVERDQVHPVVQVDLASARNDQEFLRLGGEVVEFLAELALALGAGNRRHSRC